MNSLFDSIPTYFTTLFPILGKVLKQLNKIRRLLGNSTQPKFHLVKWAKVPKEKGRGFLKKVVRTKHGGNINWHNKVDRSSHGVGPWNHISKLWQEFTTKVSIQVGNRENTLFWLDKWSSSSSLKEDFPALFSFAVEF